jgi:chromosome segregation ATPase
VVETIMIFALGVAAATLIALIFIPAITARADRLARRRAEALFPLSVEELTAEKDHLRAEFAVLQRQIERKAEEAFAVKHQSMEELGRRAVRIEALETGVSERDTVIANLQADLADTRARLATTEDELAGTRASLAGTRDTLAAIENAHRKTLDELAGTRSELDRTVTALAGTRAELALTQDRLEAREAEFADLDQRHSAALSDMDAKRITISDLETRFATQKARGDDFERALGERRNELTEERQRLTDLAKNLLAEQERGLVLEGRIRELETERDAKAADVAALTSRLQAKDSDSEALHSSLTERAGSLAALKAELEAARVRIAELETAGGTSGAMHSSELRNMSERLETLRSEKSALEGALSTAREERARLAKELKAVRRSAGTTPDEIKAENAELRRLIVDVADRVMQASDTDAGPAGGRRKATG